MPVNILAAELDDAGLPFETGLGLSSLLFCVDPIEGNDPTLCESMASWVWRLAQANGYLDAWNLLRSGGTKLQDFSRLDLGPTCHIATAVLSNLTLLPRQEVASLTLTKNLQYLGVEESLMGHPWVLNYVPPASKRKGARHAICTTCLREDAVPYWRQFWRLATAVRCPVHHHALIDRCPVCGEPIVLAHQRKTPLDQCESCGTAYAERRERTYRHSRSEWIEMAPLAVLQEHLPLKVIDPRLWWAGLRALFFVLCIPRRATRFAVSKVPSTYLPTLRMIAQSPRVDFARHSLSVRHDLLRMAAWLTRDWPANFVGTVKAAGITACDFSAMEFGLPYWLYAVVNESLYGKRYQVNQEEVRAAKAAMSKSTKPISKIALKRQLGVTEGKALDALLPARLKALSHDTIYTIMGMLEVDIQTTTSAREAKASAIRDACCIAAATWLGLSFTKVCELTLSDGLALNRTWQALVVRDETSRQLISTHEIRLAQIFCRWGDLYANGVRHRFCLYQQKTNRYFITRFGRPSGGNGLAARFADLLRRAGVNDWGAGVRLLVKDGGLTSQLEKCPQSMSLFNEMQSFNSDAGNVDE
ncbi:TniQ family protein [Rhodoferax sp. BLA1]|uniref:TniQ family protein n=1 Tax=Rhodoferax sp. BLA1 TaxID=2576062 RepID=UPI0015D2088C|nr:TniQ family protein [Rhodoferax sp. BLA1]